MATPKQDELYAEWYLKWFPYIAKEVRFRLKGFCQAKGIDLEEEVKDVTQETWLLLWRQQPTHLSKSYVKKAVDFACKDWKKHSNSDIGLPDAPVPYNEHEGAMFLADPNDLQSTLVNRDDLRTLVERFAPQLTFVQRRIFNAYLDGASQNEIAESLGLTLNAVKLHMFKLRAKLDRFLSGVIE